MWDEPSMERGGALDGTGGILDVRRRASRIGDAWWFVLVGCRGRQVTVDRCVGTFVGDGDGDGWGGGPGCVDSRLRGMRCDGAWK